MSVDGLLVDGDQIVDSTGLLKSTSLPDELVIVGAGYIGVELGTAFSKLGSSVTLVEVADRILPSLDPTLTRPVERRLNDLGVRVITNARVLDWSQPTITVTAADTEHPVEIYPNVIAIASGRVPNTDNLGIEHLNISLEPSGHVIVDSNCPRCGWSVRHRRCLFRSSARTSRHSAGYGRCIRDNWRR